MTQRESHTTLGKIESQLPGCKNRFICPWNWFIGVDRDTGLVRLKRQPPLRYPYNTPTKLTTRVKVVCDVQSQKSQFKYITVNVFVFCRYFGNSFLRSYIYNNEIGRLVKPNDLENFDTKKGMANSLHRIMRMVSMKRNPETFNEMMASTKVDIALDRAVNDIVKKHIPESSGNHSIHKLTVMSYNVVLAHLTTVDIFMNTVYLALRKTISSFTNLNDQKSTNFLTMGFTNEMQ